MYWPRSTVTLQPPAHALEGGGPGHSNEATHALWVQGHWHWGKCLGNQRSPQHPLSPEGRKATHGSCSFLSPQFLICSFLAPPPTVVQECFFFLVISFSPLVLILFLQNYGRHSTSPFPVKNAFCPGFSISKAISCSPLMFQASCRLPLFRSLGQSFQSPFPCARFPWKITFPLVFCLTRSLT